jgi:drug/metabolite transporter (DMT)-like permease
MHLSTTTASTTIPAIRSILSALDGDRPGDGPKKDLQNWSSLIGIVAAIVGNVLIALALNVQRYAHIRLHRRRTYVRLRARRAMKNAVNGGGVYGSTASINGSNANTSRRDGGQSPGFEEDEEARESDPLDPSFQSRDSQWMEGDDDDESKKEVSSNYLKDPYWWLGQVLITVGECGNFLAYGFAPASIVSPLGVFALISNCVIAPMLFKEVFRTRDFWGVIVAIAGAVTVVLSANTKETKLEPDDVWRAITTMEFEIYVALTCSLIAVLMWASPRYGNRTILIDLGLVGLYGTCLTVSPIMSLDVSH